MRKLWLPTILILAFLLRFVNLSSHPVGFNADEASFGYDAYSILHTGRDQWGNFLPLTFKSFGDFKSPIYGYLTIPFIMVLGLNIFSTRIVSVIIGTLAVYVTYLLTLEIKNKLKIKYNIEFVAGMLLAISPWSVMLSRGAFEANLITLFIPLGVLLFLKDKINISAFVFGLSLFTYHSAKIISPIIFVLLLIIFKKKKILPILIYGIFLIVTFWTLLNGGSTRLSERSITQGALEEGARAKISMIQNGTNPIFAKIVHNKFEVVISRFLSNYSQYFSFKFLFSQGAGESYYGMIHGIGVLYLFEGLLLLGVIKVFFEKRYKRVLCLLVLWIVIAPIPAALATGVGYSGHRAIGMIPAFQILESFGAMGWFSFIKNSSRNSKNILAVIIGLVVSLNFYKFISIYFKNVPAQSYQQMLYGNLEVSKWIASNNTKTILVSRSLSEPQIFIAFESKMDPLFYQSEAKKWIVETWVDQIPEYSLGNVKFKSIDWKNDTKLKDIVIVARPDDFPKGIIPDKTFDLPDGSPNIYVKNY